MKYIIKESRLREMIAESVKKVLKEGFGDNIKSALWKAKNLPPKYDYVKRQNALPHNPYTYNKRNFHDSSPEYGTKEFDKMYKADDGWVMGNIQRDIENMKAYLNGESEFDNILMGFVPKDIKMAEEYGLPKYSQYLKELYGKVKDKHQSESM